MLMVLQNQGLILEAIGSRYKDCDSFLIYKRRLYCVIEGRYPSSESAALGLIGGSPGTTFQYDVLGSNSSGYCMTAYSDRDVGAFNISHTSKHN